MTVGEAKSSMLASKRPSRAQPRKTSSEAMRSVAAIGAANWSESLSSITCEATHYAPQKNEYELRSQLRRQTAALLPLTRHFSQSSILPPAPARIEEAAPAIQPMMTASAREAKGAQLWSSRTSSPYPEHNTSCN